MPGERDISIYSGDTYSHELRLKDSSNVAIDITGRVYSGAMKISKMDTSSVAIFTTSISNAAGGIVTFTLSSNTTANITPGTYFYDFQEDNLGVVTTLLTGKATVTGQVG